MGRQADWDSHISNKGVGDLAEMGSAETEIHDLHDTVGAHLPYATRESQRGVWQAGRDQDVFGLEITMHQPAFDHVVQASH